MRQYSEYKESGIDWIGDIPVDWGLKKLKFYAEICNGKDQKQILADNGKYPIYGSGGVFGYGSAYLYDQESVLLVRKGTIDKPQFVSVPFWTVDTSFYTKMKDDTVPRFFYYLCLCINFEEYKYGSAIPSMTQSELNEIVFPDVSPCEQKAIAQYLDQKTALIDDLIDKTTRKIVLLREQRTAIINQAVTKGLDPEVPMKDSGIEWIVEIPEHWTLSKLSYLSSYIKGFAFKSRMFKDEGESVIKASDIKNGTVKKCSSYISKEDALLFQSVKLFNGDILISTVGSKADVLGSAVGQLAVVPPIFNISYLNQNMAKLYVTQPAKLDNRFYFHALTSDSFRKHLDLNAHGTANQASLSMEDIFVYKLALPPLGEQKLIARYIDLQTNQINQLIEKEEKAIDLLKEYRQALISEVVTGKICVFDEVPVNTKPYVS